MLHNFFTVSNIAEEKNGTGMRWAGLVKCNKKIQTKYYRKTMLRDMSQETYAYVVM
jgi:hypothetical protein